MHPQGYPSPPSAPQRPLLLGFGTGVKEVQPSFLPPTLRPCPGASPFPVRRKLNPALLISQIAHGEHTGVVTPFPACILASIVFVLSVFIEDSVCLSQFLLPGASSILRLSLQPGADPHPQPMSIM